MPSSDATRDMLSYIERGPSPWHVIDESRERLERGGFRKVEEGAPWDGTGEEPFFVVRYGAALLAVRPGTRPPAESGFRIVGAHTDSPTLRLKTLGVRGEDRQMLLDVEVYGGPILATFADRDFDLAGRVMLKSGPTAREILPKLFRFGRAVAHLPTLAIHMDRGVNDKGFVLDKQTHLPLLAGELEGKAPPREQFRAILARELDTLPENVLAWELNAADCQAPTEIGLHGEFVQSPRLDNLASCHAALAALLDTPAGEATAVVALFDHEEIGSRSGRGADSLFLRDFLLRLCEGSAQNLSRALAHSLLVSVDMAHAYHPNRPEAYDGEHHVSLNGGPVIKINANRRYSTDAWSEAWFSRLCEEADVPVQKYIHRTDLPCGSTIGPMSESLLGVPAIDVGNALLGMHSIRETGGSRDQEYMIRVLGRFLATG